jgi:hypothetical protein
MHLMSNRLKESRTLVPGFQLVNANNLTVFVGLFNAQDHLSNLKRNLVSQTFKNFDLLVVDNKSTDGTWEAVQDWQSLFPGRIQLVQNPINLGATGSLVCNIEMVKTEWITFFHQDDHYEDFHLETIFERSKNVSHEVVSIFSDMGRISNTGQKIASPPRAAWFVPSPDPPTQFLCNLRLHFVPFPSAFFRTHVLSKCLPPWHSTAFPDTEMILKMSAYGKFDGIRRITMRYQENPKSESHSIENAEKKLGMFVAVNRVLCSEEFKVVAAKVNADEREQFKLGIASALRARFGDSNLANILNSVARESLLVAWQYSDRDSLIESSDFYREIGGRQAHKLLSDLRIEKFGPSSVEYSSISKGETEFWNLESSKSNQSGNGTVQGLMFSWFVSLTSKFPYFLKVMISTKSLQFIAKGNADHPWNMSWKSR